MNKPISQTELQNRMYGEKLNIKYFFGSIIAEYLAKRFRSFFNFPLLDAGSGDGSVIKKLRKIYPDRIDYIFGVDLVAVPELNIVQCDLKSLTFRDQQFKTIICTEVLEHLDDDTLQKTLVQFKRVLAFGGHIICTFPYDEKLERNTFVCPYCDKSFHRFGHVRSWHSEESIEDMFKSAGFKIKYLEILPLGAVAKFPPLRLIKSLLNKFDNFPGLRKRVIVIATR